ncbi:hypothetical protein TIFTF001_007650 [Ficus carica]|uniref:Uncharacterized protein n=1 Tax=Ficus carica TaxID=3494 RepID=A0AA88A3D2_FICCA|nr:hypothetical protein TIFTF001_007650 [Ficus carica]
MEMESVECEKIYDKLANPAVKNLEGKNKIMSVEAKDILDSIEVTVILGDGTVTSAFLPGGITDGPNIRGKQSTQTRRNRIKQCKIILAGFLTCNGGLDEEPVRRVSLPKHAWQPPGMGRIKVNVDAAVNEAKDYIGVGIVARDDKGNVLGAAPGV